MPTKRAPKKAPKPTLPRWARGECPTATRVTVLDRDGGRCVYCGTVEGFMTIDHVVPQSVHVDHRPTNLVAACEDCNNKRGVVDVDLFCMHIARRTGEPAHIILARVIRALNTPV